MPFHSALVRWTIVIDHPIVGQNASPCVGRQKLRAARRLPWPRDTPSLSGDGWISAAMKFTPPPCCMDMLILISLLVLASR